jgi:hypothetical protein
MRFIRNLIGKIFIFCFSSGICAVASAQVNAISSNPPKFSVGDTWKFRKTELPSNSSNIQLHQVMAITDNDLAWIFIENMTSGFKVWWLFDGIKSATKSTYSYDSSKPNYIGKLLTENNQDSRIQFPLFAGKKYNITEYWNEKKTAHTDYEITVVGVESVTTEAGVFQAWKIVADGIWIDKTKDTTGQTKGEMWYSPEVKRWVKTKFIGMAKGRQPSVSTFELIEWKRGQ